MRWLIASGVAAALHLALALMVLPFMRPQPVPEEQLDLAKLTFGVVALDQSRAEAQKPDETSIDPSSLPNQAASIGVVPKRRAKSAPLDKIAQPVRIAPSAPPRAAIKLAKKALVPVPSRAPKSAIPIETTRPITPQPQTVRLSPIAAGRPVTSDLNGPTHTPTLPNNTEVPQAEIASITALAILETGTSLTAELYFAGGASVAFDDKTLASLQTFLSPDMATGQNPVRDDLSALLAGQECARLQTIFLPETGTVELLGHVPSKEMRQPLLTALQDRIGTGLPVQDNLLILPAPQCSVLGGISALGLPQSDEQLTNPRMIGQDTHATEYLFSEGDRLKIELTAPAYSAYVYVDYYDAEGQVIHLVPNAQTELVYYEADAPFAVGGSSSNGGLDIRIGPPFGQDIAVAFASSHPLFEAPRPLIEPAAPYLKNLAERVAAVRAENADYKGEWAYLFVRTQPAQN